jgi:pimeloyl-ACP methyl ester carboxylesterase
MKIHFDSAEHDAQLGRTLVGAYSGSADLGEALATASRIQPVDAATWYAQWSATAERCIERGEAALQRGHRATARQAFLRACEYLRQAIFFIRADLDDPRLQRGWSAHRAAFRAAIPLLDHEVVTAEIPLESARMTAYFFRAPSSRRTDEGRPVVLAPCGYDSTAEAGYAATAYMAMKRGYDCLVWEGPGQGGTLYEQRVPMRPDFEVALTRVVDWLLEQRDVDPRRIAVIGRSFAGYLGPRGVSDEPRVSALVCDPGQYDFVSRLGKFFDAETWQKILAGDPETDARIQTRLEEPHQRDYWCARMTTMGARTLGDFLRMQPAYTMEGRAERIRCPTLLTEGEGDFAAQSQRLFDALTCPKELRRFTVAEGAGGHCAGLGATLFEEVVFDWLDEVLAADRPRALTPRDRDE